MRGYSPGRLVLLAVVFAAASGIQITGQGLTSGPAARASKGTGFITGQVVDASSGKPVGSVTVSITGGGGTPLPAPGGSAAPQAPRQVVTDSDGRYLFHDLAKGRYSLGVNKPDYVYGGYGQNRPNGPTEPIDLSADDTKMGDVTIRIWKTATISGTVVDEASEPVVGLTVFAMRRTMMNGEVHLASNFNGTTDDRGIYRIAGLTPGDYLVTVIATEATLPAATTDAYMEAISAGAGFATSQIYTDMTTSGAPLPIMGGQRVDDLILQTTGMPGRGSAPIPTPDNGKVYVYPSVFYPSAMTASEATAIKLASGDDRAGIDLALRLTSSVRVSGVVTGPEGPMRNTGVKLYPAGAGVFTGFTSTETASTATDANGAFTFLGVPSGQYTLKVARIPRPAPTLSTASTTMVQFSGADSGVSFAFGIGGGGPQPQSIPTDPTLWAAVPVSVGETDVTGLAVTVQIGAHLSGRFSFEGSKTPPTADQIQRATMQISPMDGPSTGFPPQSRVDADGQFTTSGLIPGRYQLNVFSPLPGWLVKAVNLKGRNLLDDPLEVESEDISGIAVVFTDQTTNISGGVVDGRGQSSTTAEVIAFPADSTSWKQGVPNTRRIRTIRTSSAGSYGLANLPAGDYYVAAIDGSSAGDPQDPSFLGSLAAVATRVTLADGEKKTLDLVLKPVR